MGICQLASEWHLRIVPLCHRRTFSKQNFSSKFTTSGQMPVLHAFEAVKQQRRRSRLFITASGCVTAIFYGCNKWFDTDGFQQLTTTRVALVAGAIPWLACALWNKSTITKLQFSPKCGGQFAVRTQPLFALQSLSEAQLRADYVVYPASHLRNIWVKKSAFRSWLSGS